MVAVGHELFDVIVDCLVGVTASEVIGAQVVEGSLRIGEQVVGNHDDAVADGQGGAVVESIAASGMTSVVVSK